MYFLHWNSRILSWEVKIPVLAGAALPAWALDCAFLPREPGPTSSSSSFLYQCSKWDGARREQGLQTNFTAGTRWVLALFHSLPTTPKSLLKYFFSFVTCAHQESVNSKHTWDGIFQKGSCKWTCWGTWKDLASRSQTNSPATINQDNSVPSPTKPWLFLLPQEQSRRFTLASWSLGTPDWFSFWKPTPTMKAVSH